VIQDFLAEKKKEFSSQQILLQQAEKVLSAFVSSPNALLSSWCMYNLTWAE
jgi:hypothetical protein